MIWLDILRWTLTGWNIVIGILWVIFKLKGKHKAASSVFAYAFPVCFWELYKWWRDGRDINIPARYKYHLLFEYEATWVLNVPAQHYRHLRPVVRYQQTFSASGIDIIDSSFGPGHIAILHVADNTHGPTMMCGLHSDGVIKDYSFGDVDPDVESFLRRVAIHHFQMNETALLYKLEDFRARLLYAHWLPDSPMMQAYYDSPEGEQIVFHYTRFRKKLRYRRVMEDGG